MVDQRRRRRVPVVLQMTFSDCGIACLAMILRHHGHHVSLTECRKRIGVGRDGVTAGRIAAAARLLGLETRGYDVEPSACGDLVLPAIAHWDHSHFVVLERVSATRVQIVDPALGRRRLTAEEFAQGFGGLVLTFAPGDGFERPAPARLRTPMARRTPLRTSLMHCRPMLATALAASFVLQLLDQ